MLIALKNDDESLQLGGMNFLAARYVRFNCPGALELLDFLLEVRLVIRRGAGPAGRGETDSAAQCYEKDSHTCSPCHLEGSDTAAERLS